MRQFSSILPLLCIVLSLNSTVRAAEDRCVDFRWAPASSFAIISLPDDWQKTVILSDGALGYDFGPGPYARPLTRIAIALKGDSLRVQRQYLSDPTMPVMRTDLVGTTHQSSQVAFAVVPDPVTSADDNRTEASVIRRGGLNGCMAWSPAEAEIPADFRHVAWGTNRPILYRVSVNKGARERVALGFCEAYKPRAGMRVMDLRVEGASPLQFDPLEHGARNEPRVVILSGEDVNQDGSLAVEVHASPTSPDPNVILNALWVFPDSCEIQAADLARGVLGPEKALAVPCGTEWEEGASAPRIDVIRARFDGSGCTPIIRVQTHRILEYDSVSGLLRSGETFAVVSEPAPSNVRRVEGGVELELPSGSATATAYVLHGRGIQHAIECLPGVPTALSRASQYWKTESQIPTGKITVPDSSIQYLLEASIRTIYQVRERVDGRRQYQPGPSVYRGLWAGDLALTAVAALVLGDTSGVREFIEQVLAFQGSNGQVRVMVPVVSVVETPMLLFAMNRLARSTGSNAWLQERWHAFCAAADWISKARDNTLETPGAVNAGLMPTGFVDGGIAQPTADYGSVWWALTGLESAIDAAGRLGDSLHRRSWTATYDRMRSSLRRALRRDLRADSSGLRFLPVAVGGGASGLPQRGQYTFLLPLPYGRFFADEEDSLVKETVRGNLAMLDARCREGLVVDAGWLGRGVWPWLGACHSMAHALYGDATHAADILYAVANHAAESGTWVEEQQLRSVGSAVSGDASNAEAAAAFVLAVRTMIAREHLDNLEILPCLPAQWIRPGATISLRETTGPFGTFSLTLKVDSTGTEARLHVSAVDGRGTVGHPVAMLDVLRNGGFRATDGSALPHHVRLSWGRDYELKAVRTQ